MTPKVNNYTITHDAKDGYSITSNKTNNTYFLLEGFSYKGSTSADIVYIMQDTLENFKFIDFLFGAEEESEILKDVISIIEKYEKKHLKGGRTNERKGKA